MSENLNRFMKNNKMFIHHKLLTQINQSFWIYWTFENITFQLWKPVLPTSVILLTWVGGLIHKIPSSSYNKTIVWINLLVLPLDSVQTDLENQMAEQPPDQERTMFSCSLLLCLWNLWQLLLYGWQMLFWSSAKYLKGKYWIKQQSLTFLLTMISSRSIIYQRLKSQSNLFRTTFHFLLYLELQSLT